MIYPIVVFYAICVAVEGRAREGLGLAVAHPPDLPRRKRAGGESDEYAVRSRVTVQRACDADLQRHWPAGCLLWSDVGSNYQCPRKGANRQSECLAAASMERLSDEMESGPVR